ncbi:unnamed protein product [Leptidea sinapis]|uniref:Uncharacterized protein n=1 Tax=Leptidea sinapis TaxID=189913 RepID=A0A5E4R090_9NEOP|nr:unnamed protein product [Leptidea sinapis]
MKRKHNVLDTEESKLSSLLFKRSNKFVEQLDEKKEDENLDQKPAWIDEDDDNFRTNAVIPKVKSDGPYSLKLKQKFETLIGTPQWAKITKVNSGEDDSDILKSVGHLGKRTSTKFERKILEFKGSTKIQPQKAKRGLLVPSIEFHPKVSAVLFGGSTGIVSLYSIGEEENKLHGFKLKNWFISSAQFNPDGTVAYISSKNQHNYCMYDIEKAQSILVQFPQVVKRPHIFKLSPDGKYFAATDCFELVFLICAKSRELLRTLKNNTKVQSITFSNDSKHLYCFNEEGVVTVWDLFTFRSVKKFYDNGCVTAARISMSPCGRLLATGTGEGIVNVYETAGITSYNPVPLKTISNLQTKITDLKFNPTSEILSVVSSYYPNAIKLVHIPSYHVFSNFPTQNMDQVETVSFSPNSGYMAISNNKSCVNIFRLKHFKNY